MRELKRKVVNEFKDMIIDLKEEIKEAEESGDGLNVTELWGKTAEHFAALDAHFLDAEARYIKNRKSFLGGA